jgi:hypothetical protein
MAELWYYAHGGTKTGPCSGAQLQELAAAGLILPTDTVWKGGVARGVPARKVKHLFRPAHADPPPGQAPPPPPAVVAGGAGPKPHGDAPAALVGAGWQPKPARAEAVWGAVLLGQDGRTVEYRKKCTACAYEEWGARSTMPIRGGLTTVEFFCPRCRKVRRAEIRGFTS